MPPRPTRRWMAGLVAFVFMAGLQLAWLLAWTTHDLPLRPDGSIRRTVPAVDDAYITYRIARNWASGHGPVTNAGDRVEASSSPLFVGVLAAAVRAGWEPVIAARWLGVALALAICAMFVAVGTSRVRTARDALAWSAIGLLLALHPTSPFHVSSGLETMLASALLLFAVVAADEAWPAWLSPALFFLFAACRPEGVAVGIAVFCVEVAWIAVDAKGDGAASRHLGSWLVGFALPVAALIGVRWFYYGDAVPNTVLAKQGFPVVLQALRSLNYLRGWLQQSGGLVLLSLGTVFLGRERRVRAGLVVLVALIGFVSWAGSGDAYPYWRYAYPAIPVAALLAARFLEDLLRPHARGQDAVGGQATRRVPAALGAALAAAALMQLVLTIGPGRPGPRWLRSPPGALSALVSPGGWPDGEGAGGWEVGLFQLAEWLRVRATADDELAAAEIGIVPYYSGLRVLDIFGLADRHIARLPGLPGAKSDPDYIFGRKPRFILMRIDDSCLCGALPADVPLFNDSRMIADYELARSIKAGSSRIVLFERRATPLFDLHYDFGNAWNPSRLRVVSAAGETLPEAPLGEPAPLVPTFLASPDVRDRRRAEARAALGDDSSPEVRATAMREWLSAFRPFLAEPSTPGIAAPGRPRLELRYDVEIPANARLRFAIGAPEDTWTPESGDGMGFEIRVRSSDSRETLVFDETIDPRHDPAQRRWLEREVDLSPWNGQRITIAFSTTAGPAGDMRGDFPGWGRPLLVSALDDIVREP